MSLDPPPPPPMAYPSPPRGGLTKAQRGGLIVLGALGFLAVLIAVVIFAAGETLFGSDPGTIDGYNRDVLNSCDVPPDSTLVQAYVLDVAEASGHFRSMSHIYASPLSADQIVAFYGLDRAGMASPVSRARVCQFENRPSALVLSLWTPEHTSPFDPASDTKGLPADPGDKLWAGDDAKVIDNAPIPAGAHSVFGLRLAQREVDGLSGLGPSEADAMHN